MKVRLARSLVARVYALALGCVVLMIVAQSVLFQFLRPPGKPGPGGPPPGENRSVASALGAIPDESTALRVLEAIERDDRGDLTLLDRTGAKLFEHGRPAPDLDAEVLAAVARTGAFQGPGYSAQVVRGGGLDGAVVIRRAMPSPTPGPPSFPVAPVVAVLGATLLIALAMSWWFARRLAAPLSILRAAAERFGEGALSARAFLERGDEL
ncbi:MAG: hypothetical protein K8W52_44745, partial [Deltaproteobacteria bacterium]|nr:hypothetical protein [Deltaproteobacteria bacterium]